MNRTRRILAFCILLAAVGLAAGYAQGGQLAAGLWLAALGLAWLAARRLDRGWIDSIALLLYTGAAALGLLFQAPAGWMLASAAAALAAWDLAYFLRRVKGLEGEKASQALERQHLLRLAGVIATGLGIAGAAMLLAPLLRLRFSFGLALIGGLLVFIALSQVIGFLRRESD
jgi:hypothetical protein